VEFDDTFSIIGAQNSIMETSTFQILMGMYWNLNLKKDCLRRGYFVGF